MGNPVITRLGRNQFWYKKWYNDWSYSHNLKVVNTFEIILNSYLKYGFFFNKNMFFYNYWYKNFTKKENHFIKDTEHLSTYYRRYFYSHKTLSIEHTYLLRVNTPEYFPLRTYFLKYLNWLVVSVQWFKPAKSSYSANKHSTQNNNIKLMVKGGRKVSKTPTANSNVRYKLFFMLLNKLPLKDNLGSYNF
jgi:hypothetical protein